MAKLSWRFERKTLPHTDCGGLVAASEHPCTHRPHIDLRVCGCYLESIIGVFFLLIEY